MESLPTDPKRVKSFAKFFKNYMSVSTIVTAALPVPITSFKLIPVYTAHKDILSIYTSLFCFLVLAFIFYSRHSIAVPLFKISHYGRKRRGLKPLYTFLIQILPVTLIAGSVLLLFYYHELLQVSLGSIKSSTLGKDLSTTDILNLTEIDKIPSSTILLLSYLGIFVLAESAFILMAIKEYLQDLLGLTEKDMLLGDEALAMKMGSLIKQHEKETWDSFERKR